MKWILRCGAVLTALLTSVSWAGPREDVNASIDKFLAARSFHAEMTMSGPRPMSHQLDFVAPGRYRMRMPGMGEQYIIGDTMFLSIAGKSGPGKTLKVPMPKGTLSQWRDPARLAENAAGMSVSALGEESVGGAHAKKYRVVHTKPQPSVMTLWVGRDGYPLQIITSGNAQGKSVTTTIRYSRFNDPTIRVDPPK
ncbi:MAG: LolA family protein [Lysobacter sp.]